MQKQKLKTCVFFALLGLVMTFYVPTVSGEEIERFTGNIIFWAGFEAGNTERLTMSIERWTTDEERDRLLVLLKEKGNDAMLDDLQKRQVGWVWTTGNVRYPLSFAYSEETPEGRIITLATERPFTFEELIHGPLKARQYMMGYVEFILDESGRGQGLLIEAAKIRLNDKEQVEVETFWTNPHILRNVKKQK